MIELTNFDFKKCCLSCDEFCEFNSKQEFTNSDYKGYKDYLIDHMLPDYVIENYPDVTANICLDISNYLDENELTNEEWDKIIEKTIKTSEGKK